MSINYLVWSSPPSTGQGHLRDRRREPTLHSDHYPRMAVFCRHLLKYYTRLAPASPVLRNILALGIPQLFTTLDGVAACNAATAYGLRITDRVRPIGGTPPVLARVDQASIIPLFSSLYNITRPSPLTVGLILNRPLLYIVPRLPVTMAPQTVEDISSLITSSIDSHLESIKSINHKVPSLTTPTLHLTI